MALIQCSFSSDVLEVGTSMSVVLPQNAASQIGVDAADSHGSAVPVLYLLHGLSDDATAWTRYTSIERYATALGLAVVMPQVQRSFYRDQVHGGRYWTFLTQELPEVVRRFFRVSARREDTFVAGLSMGGYGAMKLGAERTRSGSPPPRACPARSTWPAGAGAAGCATTSPTRCSTGRHHRHGRRPGQPAGRPGRRRAARPSAAVRHLWDRGRTAPGQRALPGRGAALGLDVTTDLRPGEHEWGYWDTVIQDVLAWLRPGPGIRIVRRPSQLQH